MVIENAKFKERYGRYLLESLAATIVLHLIIFTVIPPFEFSPYVSRTDDALEYVTMEPVVEIPIEPEEIVPPELVPVLNEDGVEEETLVFPISSPPVPDFTTRHVRITEESVHSWQAYDRDPVLIRYQAPVYPELALIAGTEGSVLLRITIGRDGRVEEAEVIDSSVTGILEKAAITAVMQFLFEPARQGTVPVKVSMKVPFTFRLN